MHVSALSNGSDSLFRVPTHERCLANGLTVLVREDHSSPVVAIVTHVKAGYFNEPDPVVGISHVLEHMYFKGTERFGAGEIARATKAVGGYLNAGTIYDYTTYYTVLPASVLEHGLEIQSDALKNSQIDPDELRRELLVIIQEAKRKLDNPRAVATESLYERMFDVHRIRRWRIGTEPGLRRLTREDVWRYYRELYRASNTILVIAGDVEADRAFELVERYYGDMPAGEAVRDLSPEEPERVGLRFHEMAGDIVQTHLAWGWPTPGTLDPDTPALDVLAVVLGQGRGSRLYRGVREAGWVTAIGASNYTPTELGVFSIAAELRPEDARGAIRATWSEIEALRRTGPGAAEVERARNLLEARMLRNLETVEGQAMLLARWQALGDWRLAGRYLDAILAATAEDLVRVAGEYLGLERSTLLVYRPQAAEPLGWTAAEAEVEARLEVGTVPAGRGGGAAARADAAGEGAGDGVGEGAEDAAGVPEPVAAGRAPSPRTVAARPPGVGGDVGVEDGVHFYEFANGVRLAVRPRPSSPLVTFGVFFAGGSIRERPEEAGLTGLLARVSIKGTARRSAARLAEETEALGGSIVPAVGADMFYWTLSVPARYFAQGFEVLSDVVLHPSFPEPEFERERRIALSDLDRLRDDMYRYPLHLFLQGAFPDHPYGYPAAVLESVLTAADRSLLERWHRSQVLEARPWVVAVGGVEPDAVAAVVQSAMEPVQGLPAPPDPPPPAWPEGPREEAEHRSKAQTAFVLGFPGPERNHPDSYAFDVLSNAISGLGGRFFEELRSRRSLAYSVSAFPLTRVRAGAFVTYIATSPEREDEARRAILEELDRLAEETLAAEEVERAQEYTIGAWKIRGQTNTAQLGDIAAALVLGRGLSELRDFEERIRAVTPIAIREVYRRHYAPDRLIEGMVRGEATGAG